MEIRALGPLEVVVDGESRPVGGPKPSMLLAALLVDSGRVVSSDRLELALWGDDPPKSAAHAIHVHVGKVRSVLRTRSDDSDWVETVGDGYRIEVESASYDVARFESLLAAAAEEPDSRIQILTEALGLWRGRPFGSLADEESIRIEAERLEQLRSRAIDDLIGAQLAAGLDAELVPRIEEELARRPLQERLWQHLMLALYRSGRQAEALRAFGRLRTLLGEEMGIEPSAESRELENRILLQDPGLALHPERRIGNLPAPLTALVGRTAAIESITDALRSNRLVTLLGPPGVGKSRLALEVADRVEPDHEGGVWYRDVTDIAEPSLFGADLASTVGVEHGTGDVVGSIAERVGDANTLLLLDGCERAVEQVGHLVPELLGRCPRLTVLVTSLRKLGSEGEGVVVVDPLGQDAAEALFLERARSAGASNVDEEVDREAITAICRRLEGVPLALELVAARTDVLTPHQILERLDDRLGLLVPGEGADERRRALDAALEWSLALLPESVVGTYSELAVFRDGFDLEAAEQVTGRDVLDDLSLLVSHSLLSSDRRAGIVRYRMLDAIRQHARLALERAGEADRATAAHADLFKTRTASMERGLMGSDQLDWLVRFDADHGNVRAALTYFVENEDVEASLEVAANASWYWFLRSHLQEGWHWLGRILPMAEGQETIGRVRALIRASQFAWEQSANRQAREWLQEALELSDRLGSTGHRAWASVYLGMLNLMDGDHEAALRVASEARATFEEAGNLAGLGFSVFVEASSPLLPAWLENRLDPAEIEVARDRLMQIGSAAAAVGERNLIGHIEWALGLFAAAAGDRKASNDHLRSSTRSFVELGNLSCLCHTLDAVALVRSTAGESERAAQVLGMVRALRSHTGNPGHRFEVMLHDLARSSVEEALGEDQVGALVAEGERVDIDQILSTAWEAGTTG